MSPLRIAFLDRETLPPEVRFGTFGFAADLVTFPRTAPAEVAERIASADIVITNKVPISAADIATASRLRLIAVAATGTNMVDLAAARSRGILVSNVRNYSAYSVPEHTFALMLTLRRNILAYRASVAAGRWQDARQFCFFDHPIADLGGSTLGIIGGGTLGSAVARLGEAFGMEILIAGRKGEVSPPLGRTPFADVLALADVITLHLPLLPETRHLIGAPEFAAMARRPLLINAARGGLVDEIALRDALVGGQISGAGLDVAESEPPPADSVLMQLLDRPDFILTPHVAWASRQSIQSLADQLTRNIDAFVAGEPRNLV